MKILILGHGRAGKDTVAELLQEMYGYSFISSSLACAEMLKPCLDLLQGEKSANDHFACRHLDRELWKRLISLYCAADAGALTKLILSKSDVYVGMRSKREFDASWKRFDLILWVDAGERLDYVDPTLDIDYDPRKMGYIDNNGTLEDLRHRVRQLPLVSKEQWDMFV